MAESSLSIPMRLLVIEDDNDWRDLLKRGFGLAAERMNVKLGLEQAQTIADAKTLLRQGWFHAVSIDQNMPEVPGGKTSSEHGEDFAISCGRRAIPAFMAIYTGYPSIAKANRIGRYTGAAYILKSMQTNPQPEQGEENGEQSMSALDYATWFLQEFRRKYFQNVLVRAESCGDDKLADTARKARKKYEKIYHGYALDSDFNGFLVQVDGLRDELLRCLTVYTYAIWSSELKDCPLPRKDSTAGYRIKWLKDAWSKLEQQDEKSFKDWASYMMAGAEDSLMAVFIDKALSPLNRRRNKAQHELIPYTSADFDRYIPQLIRFFDLLLWFTTRPIITQLVRRPFNLLAYHELNLREPEEREIFVSPQLLPEAKGHMVWTRLTDAEDAPFINISDGYEVRRNRDGKLRFSAKGQGF